MSLRNPDTMQTDFAALSLLYKEELFENVIPFWLNNSVDHQYGGYFTCLTREGKVFDTDKFIWMQARQVWMFSTLYNKVRKDPEWLACAVHGGEYLKKYGHDGKYNWYFSLTREGRPLIDPYNITRNPVFSCAFAAMAFAQLSLATGSEEYADIARKTFEMIRPKTERSKSRPDEDRSGARHLKSLGLPMILCNLALELGHLLDEPVLNEVVEASVHDVLDVFYRPELGIMVENVTAEGKLSDTFEGRLVNPGHAIEVLWFVMDLGRKYHRFDFIEKAAKLAVSMAAYGWDEQYGGIVHFMDRSGYPTEQLDWDQKVWWVHLEALVTMIKGYQLTGSEECLAWFEKIHQYTWERFKDKEYAEWFGYLNRQGEVLLSLKGGKWKGCFHVPRSLYQCWKTLEMLSETARTDAGLSHHTI